MKNEESKKVTQEETGVSQEEETKGGKDYITVQLPFVGCCSNVFVSIILKGVMARGWMINSY